VTEVLTSRDLLTRYHKPVWQRRSSLAATVRELMPGVQPEERYSSRVATKQMPRLDVLLLAGRVGGEQPADDADGRSRLRTCDSTDVRLHVEFGVTEDSDVKDDSRW